MSDTPRTKEEIRALLERKMETGEDYKLNSREECLHAGHLIREEFAKIHKIFDDMFAKMEAEDKASTKI